VNVPSKEELMHLRIQSAMRDHFFGEDQVKYLGERVGHHWYLIGGEHEVSADQFIDFDLVEDEDYEKP